ncbi:MAG TPA: sigma-70 family RNA polymerase sigma factor [Patescibacteria group bacterium]|nr:sigma-70 family RNA polymerase sigma factor [Patescibacteria group bacterium]
MTEIPSVQVVASELQAALSEIEPTALEGALANLQSAETEIRAVAEGSESGPAAGMVAGIALATEGLQNTQEYLALGASLLTAYLADIAAEGVAMQEGAVTATAHPTGETIHPLTAAAQAEAQAAREQLEGQRTNERLDILRGLSDPALAELLRSGEPGAGDVLIERHQGLLYLFARTELTRAQRSGDVRGMDVDDLWVEAALEFIESARRFDPARETQLSTFAGSNAQYAIKSALAEQGHNVRIPTDFRNNILRRVRQLNTERLNAGRPSLTPAEIARLTGVEEEEGSYLRTVGDVYRAALLTTHLGSLNSGYSGRELGADADISDQLPYTPTSGTVPPGPEETVMRELLREVIEDMLKTLSTKEVQWIRMRYLTDEPKTLRDAAIEMGFSMEWGRRLEARALNKLRHPYRRVHVDSYNMDA